MLRGYFVAYQYQHNINSFFYSTSNVQAPWRIPHINEDPPENQNWASEALKRHRQGPGKSSHRPYHKQSTK